MHAVAAGLSAVYCGACIARESTLGTDELCGSQERAQPLHEADPKLRELRKACIVGLLRQSWRHINSPCDSNSGENESFKENEDLSTQNQNEEVEHTHMELGKQKQKTLKPSPKPTIIAEVELQAGALSVGEAPDGVAARQVICRDGSVFTSPYFRSRSRSRSVKFGPITMDGAQLQGTENGRSEGQDRRSENTSSQCLFTMAEDYTPTDDLSDSEQEDQEEQQQDEDDSALSGATSKVATSGGWQVVKYDRGHSKSSSSGRSGSGGGGNGGGSDSDSSSSGSTCSIMVASPSISPPVSPPSSHQSSRSEPTPVEIGGVCFNHDERTSVFEQLVAMEEKHMAVHTQRPSLGELALLSNTPDGGSSNTDAASPASLSVSAAHPSIQMGNACWEVYCLEYGIQLNGELPTKETISSSDDNEYNTFISETSDKDHCSPASTAPVVEEVVALDFTAGSARTPTLRADAPAFIPSWLLENNIQKD